MSEPAFDAESVFDEDYLYFYAARDEGGERSEAETELLWRLLELEPGMRVLGTLLFLDRARADAADRGVAVECVHGDMRELPWSDRFDRVINWFTSFGYFDDDGDRRVLAEAARTVKTGGRLAIDLNNLVAVLRSYQTTISVERDGDLMVDRHRLEPITGRNVVERTIIRGGAVRRMPYSVRLFAYPELRDWLLGAGFSTASGFGEDAEPLNAEHRRMIAVAHR